MAKLIGQSPDQVPTNADLGTMAYQDATDVKLESLNVTDGIRTVLKTDKDLYTTVTVGIRPNDDGHSTLSFDAGQSQAIKIEGTSSSTLGLFTSSTKQMEITSTGEVQVASGLLELDGNDIGGTQVTIADDAVASITPPRNGGFMMICCDGDGDYPRVNFSGMVYYDVGLSLQMVELAPWGTYAYGSSNLDVSITDVTGTTGTDDHITVAAQSGVIKIENRSGGSRTLQVTFL